MLNFHISRSTLAIKATCTGGGGNRRIRRRGGGKICEYRKREKKNGKNPLWKFICLNTDTSFLIRRHAPPSLIFLSFFFTFFPLLLLLLIAPILNFFRYDYSPSEIECVNVCVCGWLWGIEKGDFIEKENSLWILWH
jgi:hypothetical protein